MRVMGKLVTQWSRLWVTLNKPVSKMNKCNDWVYIKCVCLPLSSCTPDPGDSVCAGCKGRIQDAFHVKLHKDFWHSACFR